MITLPKMTQTKSSNGILRPNTRPSVAVIGMGIEGGSLAQYFLGKGADVTIHHWMPLEELKTHPKLGPQYHELKAAGASFSTGEGYLTGLTRHDVVGILQSAFTYRYPENRAALEEVQDLGIPLVTNLSIFFDQCPAHIVGITGTNGKSTTTEMAAGILQHGARRVWAGGNLGASPLDVLEDLETEDLVLLELSNYQLEFLDESPWISAVTNIAPDHLVDYEGDYKAYKAAKRRIIDFQSRHDWAVLNYDDPITRAWLAACQAQPFPFSRQTALERGAFVHEDAIVIRGDKTTTTICQTKDLPVPGAHNVENALCAAAIGALNDVAKDGIASGLTEYTPGEHRLEFVGEWNDILFYNDSKSTTPSSTIAAVQAFPDRPVILLAGGQDKGLPWSELAQVAEESCKAVIVFGEARVTLEREFSLPDRETPSKLTIKGGTTLEDAVETAAAEAESGDVVVLSPACTSFDAYENYAQRGRHFKQLIRELGATNDE